MLVMLTAGVCSYGHTVRSTRDIRVDHRGRWTSCARCWAMAQEESTHIIESLAHHRPVYVHGRRVWEDDIAAIIYAARTQGGCARRQDV